MNSEKVFELEAIDRKMDANLSTRHTYLSFAFTTTIATLAAVFALSMKIRIDWLILTPFVVIIPFQTRITYARLTHAKYEAYVKVVYKNEIQLYHYPVYELFGFMGKIIAIISNFELTFLAIAIDICYFGINKPSILLSVNVILPIFLTLFVALLALYSYDYMKFEKRFEKEFQDLIKRKSDYNNGGKNRRK